MTTKYIIYLENRIIPTPILFPEHVPHNTFLKIISKESIISAGFVEIIKSNIDGKPIAICSGFSESLNLESHSEDEQFINKYILDNR